MISRRVDRAEIFVAEKRPVQNVRCGGGAQPTRISHGCTAAGQIDFGFGGPQSDTSTAYEMPATWFVADVTISGRLVAM